MISADVAENSDNIAEHSDNIAENSDNIAKNSDNITKNANINVSSVLHSKYFTCLKLGNQNIYRIYSMYVIKLNISLSFIQNRLMWPTMMLLLSVFLKLWQTTY